MTSDRLRFLLSIQAILELVMVFCAKFCSPPSIERQGFSLIQFVILYIGKCSKLTVYIPGYRNEWQRGGGGGGKRRAVH